MILTRTLVADVRRLIRHNGDPDSKTGARELIACLRRAEDFIRAEDKRTGNRLDHLWLRHAVATIGEAGYTYSAAGIYNIPAAVENASRIAELRIAYGGAAVEQPPAATQVRESAELPWGTPNAPRFLALAPDSETASPRLALYPVPAAGDILTVAYRASRRPLDLNESIAGSINFNTDNDPAESSFNLDDGVVAWSANELIGSVLDLVPVRGRLLAYTITDNTHADINFDNTEHLLDGVAQPGDNDAVSSAAVVIDTPSLLPDDLAALLPAAAFDIFDQGILSAAVKVAIVDALRAYTPQARIIQIGQFDQFGRPRRTIPGVNPLSEDY